MRKLVWGTALGVLGLGLVLLAGAAHAAALRVGTDVDAQSLDPRTQRDTTGYRINNLVYSGLVQLDATFAPVPDLATAWQQTDPTTWVFTLRDDAKFQDGTAVTPEDVVFTYRTILDPELNARFRSLYEPIKSVDVTGQHSVTFTLKQPYAPLLSYLDLGIVPKHAVDAGRDLATQPLGSGPFRFVRWDRGSKIMLAANDAAFGGRPKLDALSIVLVPDNTARAQALEAGDLDIIMAPLSPQDVKRLAGDKRWTHHALPGVAITYLNFDMRNPVLALPEVRRAVAMLTDQATVIGQIYGGVAVPATSLLIPSLAWSYTPDIRQPATDPAAAKTLLADAGWKAGPDGVLAKNGQRLALTLSTHSEDPNRIQTVEFLQNALQDAGFDAKVSVTDWPAFIAATQTGKYDLAFFGWTLLVDPDRAMYSQLHSGGSLNFGAYANPDLDRYLDAGRSAASLPERAAAYQAAARIIASDLPYYVMGYDRMDTFADAAAAGFVPDARGYLRSLAAP
ncbi:MAG: ABC transporter substrate-binding protein [Acidisphaera sp.]|nr:ABC transporter substrate-binding protein [Acidisphaera sp.]MBV9814017.1 ABC transporter substrate-binding protein [Acetobacteraceae bacterium]